jgi:hypothetical protein
VNLADLPSHPRILASQNKHFDRRIELYNAKTLRPYMRMQK